MNFSTIEIETPDIVQVAINEEDLTVELSDGRTITVPIAWFPRLVHATERERANWRLIAGGKGIHWPDLDEDISVQALILGKPSQESPESLKKWLDSHKKKT
ncbi:hypothetical protein Calab_1410 [Caldithrix abyssi DSM 13497]|uniref:DUF2442 domain-containing protein n=1 Tax=Caldithrix abyssi DSM 13497 TaxID=880073 RepID=H1XP39_CALAY|nr:DUF2442 domain-containing protein [Caldithrix abyssi]APF20444.1 Protein of unknown function (DUF2442) [Caldithrix abyssi DSM 13497]EHO41031.1 hypothetical protein Calab_1410 [Caldithrix abyssi DSM 13497]